MRLPSKDTLSYAKLLVETLLLVLVLPLVLYRFLMHPNHAADKAIGAVA